MVAARAIATIAAVVGSAAASVDLRAQALGELVGTRVAFPAEVGRPELLTGQGAQAAFVDYPSVALYVRSPRGGWRRATAVGGGPGELRAPIGLQFDSHERLWISDRANGRVSLRSRDGLTVTREFRPELPITGLAPLKDGKFVALSETSLLVLLDSLGRKLGEVPLPLDLRAIHPVTNERFLLRLDDTTAVVTYKWYDRRIAISVSGRVLFDSIGSATRPEVLAMRLDSRGSMAYRVKPGQHEFVIHATAHDGVLYELRGSADSSRHGRDLVLVDGATGRTIGRRRLSDKVFAIAANVHALLGIAEDPNGYALFEFRWSSRRVP